MPAFMKEIAPAGKQACVLALTAFTSEERPRYGWPLPPEEPYTCPLAQLASTMLSAQGDH